MISSTIVGMSAAPQPQGMRTPVSTAGTGPQGPADQVASGSAEDPIARVDRLIDDLRTGTIQYAPEIAARTRPVELTLSNFPCRKYILDARSRPMDAQELPTEIVPKGEKSRYKHAVTVDSKLTEKENRKDLEHRADAISTLADELARQKSESLMVLIEGDNAGGKDGMLKHVFSLSPLTTSGVSAFKAASPEERQHDPNWRIMQKLAGPGQIGFHNRTAYGDVVFAAKTDAARAERIAGIKEMEYGLTMGLPMTPEGRIALPDATGHVDPSAIQRSPMRFIKVFLNVSKPEQAARLADRLLTDDKADKITVADVKGHPEHNAIQSAFADAMAATSTPWAPSYYIPNDNKTTGWRKMAQISEEILADMDPRHPAGQITREDRQEAAKPLLEEVRQELRKQH